MMTSSFVGHVILERPEIQINKPFSELIPLIEDGRAVYAHTGKQGTMEMRQYAPGRYIYEFEWLNLRISWSSDKTETLTDFLENINFEVDAASDEFNEIALEMKNALAKPVWSTIDEASYNMWLHYDSKQKLKRSYSDSRPEATKSTPAQVRDIYTLAYAACATLANGLMDQPAISHLARCLANTVEDSCFDLDRREENYDNISLDSTSVEALRHIVNNCILQIVQGQFARE